MIAEILNSAVNEVLANRCKSREQQDVVVAILMQGFLELRKKPVPDIEDRIKRMEKRFKDLAESVSMGFLNDSVVIITSGASESLMIELKRGTDWYVPWDRIDEIVLAAVLTNPSKS